MRHLLIRICLLCLLCVVAACSSQTIIVNSVSEREANELVVLLNSKGIKAVKVPSPVSTVGGGGGEKMWDITVPPQNITESLAVLNQAGLPRTRGTTLLDLFGKSGLVPSDLQDRIRYQEGLSEQLANTIRKMDGIIDADVQFTMPSTESTTPETLTASVYVKHRGILDNPNCLLMTKIKRLVACAIPGLAQDNVCVIADRAMLSDITLPSMQEATCEKDFLSIWGITVTKDSAPLFRFIFYLFLILLFLCLACIGWLLWKFYPLLEQYGGFKSLFRLKPLKLEEKIEIPPENKENF